MRPLLDPDLVPGGDEPDHRSTPWQIDPSRAWIVGGVVDEQGRVVFPEPDLTFGWPEPAEPRR